MMFWMPLRIVVVAPLAGSNTARPAAPRRVTKEGLDDAIRAIAPRVVVSAPRIPSPDAFAAGTPAPGPAADITLEFGALADFTPRRIIERVPALAALLAARDADRAHAAEIDRALSNALDAILHHPAFLALESAWRGVDFLAKRGGAGEGSEAAFLLDLFVSGGADEAERYRAQVFDPDYEDRSDVPLAAVLADADFDHQAASLETLTRYGQLAKALQSPFVASSGASLFGLKNLAHLPALPDLATRTSGGPYAAWSAFLRDDVARWVSLTTNRFLLRALYGDGGDAASSSAFHYTERVDAAHPEWLPWGRAVWAVGVSLAASFAEHGHCAACDGLTGKGAHYGLPIRAVPQGGNRTSQLATEILIDDAKAWDLVRLGVTPLIGRADGDVAYFPFVGNIYRAVMGSVTIDQTLSYYLYLGQLSHYVLRLVPSLPAGSAVERAAWLETQIFGGFSPFVGDAPGERVKVVAQEGEGGAAVANIQVAPTFKLQEKAFTLEMGIAI